MRSIPLPALALVLVCACSSNGDPCASNPSSCRDAGSGGGPSGPGSCTGFCAPHAPIDWFTTILLWIGPESATPPSCPSALAGRNPGFADTKPTVSCPQCSCSPSQGGFCFEPDNITANPGACPGAGGKVFNLPQGWGGTCEATNLTSTADSFAVAPPGVPCGACDPVQTGPMTVHGPTQALACSGEPTVAPGTCGDQSMVCAYPKTPEFMTCISKVGQFECPNGWPTRHIVFYNELECGCDCGPPVGDSCSATVTAYADSACSQPLGSVMVSSDKPQGCAAVANG
jgi:hypothetical protein